MKFVSCNKEELSKCYKLGRNQKLLVEFNDSGLECAEVIDYHQKDAKICQSNLTVCAARLGLGNSVKRGERVFLVKKDFTENT